MKKILIILAVTLTVIAAIGALFLIRYGDLLGINLVKPSPEKYLKQAITYIDAQGIYASGAEWEALRQEILGKAPEVQSYDECHQLINEALKVAGGKHSRILEPGSGDISEAELPSTQWLEDDILYIKLPGFSGSSDEGKAYAESVYSVLSEHAADVKSVIIDLRGNHGGDMGYMVAAVSPLLPDGDLMYFDYNGTRMPVTLKDGTVSGGGSTVTMDNPFKIDQVPVMLIQDEETGSSAEALRICFWGYDNVTVFGKPTAGYCSCNNTRKLYDGAVILLTVGKDIPWNGECEFCEDPIPPDIDTDTPYEDAVQKALLN